jgi:hypothetical protein
VNPDGIYEGSYTSEQDATTSMIYQHAKSVGRLIKSAGLNVRTFATAQDTLANLGKEASRATRSLRDLGLARGQKFASPN